DLIEFCKDTGLQSRNATIGESTIKLIGALHTNLLVRLPRQSFFFRETNPEERVHLFKKLQTSAVDKQPGR
ncbi:hypothetical protein IFM89_013002, partial [Coptis chinensis]